jgi:hypothetical protein
MTEGPRLSRPRAVRAASGLRTGAATLSRSPPNRSQPLLPTRGARRRSSEARECFLAHSEQWRCSEERCGAHRLRQRAVASSRGEE